MVVPKAVPSPRTWDHFPAALCGSCSKWKENPKINHRNPIWSRAEAGPPLLLLPAVFGGAEFWNSFPHFPTSPLLTRFSAHNQTLPALRLFGFSLLPVFQELQPQILLLISATLPCKHPEFRLTVRPLLPAALEPVLNSPTCSGSQLHPLLSHEAGKFMAILGYKKMVQHHFRLAVAEKSVHSMAVKIY